MKVLAIDPGYGRCGVAVVERGNAGERLVFSDCIETSSKTAFPERLRYVGEIVRQLLVLHEPDAVALEKLFFQKNQKTAMQVAEVRGALIEKAAQHGVEVCEYTPGQVKSAVAGAGNAQKHAVAVMVRALLKVTKQIQHDDEYDAIAIGLTHLAYSRNNKESHYR